MTSLGLDVYFTYKFYRDDASIEWLKKKIQFEKYILKNLYKREIKNKNIY